MQKVLVGYLEQGFHFSAEGSNCKVLVEFVAFQKYNLTGILKDQTFLLHISFLFSLRAHAEAPSSVKHDIRAEPGEKMKNREEVVNEGSDDGKAVESSDEDAPVEEKKKKQRSGFRDRKVCILVALEYSALNCSQLYHQEV